MAFGKTDFGLLRGLLDRVPWDKALEVREKKPKISNMVIYQNINQESWLIFKGHLQAQEQYLEACMDERGGPGQTQAEKESLQEVEARTCSLGGIQ